VDMASSGARQEAFRHIYEAHYQHVGAYARRRLGEQDADDVVAETFLVAWRRLDEIPPGDETLPWLYGVARRIVSQGRRTVRRRDRLLARLVRVRGRDELVMSVSEQIDEQEVVRTALDRLRPDDQELLRLAEWEDLATPRLAHIFGCSTNAIAIRLHRAHRRLAQALAAVEGDVPSPKRGAGR
jgi:RNA polymerase sigma factor (sigma-70 family)